MSGLPGTPLERPRPVGGETMSPSLIEARNYYAWIMDRFVPYLGRRVLDVGGGNGPLLDHVVARGRSVTAVDLSADCVREMQLRFRGQALEARQGDIADPALAAELAGAKFDTVLCVNVLEHIERDGAALRSLADILRPAGGRLLLLVPAHPLLFGTPDTLAGHFRRYSRKGLRRLLEESGFRVERLSFFNAPGVIPYFITSRLVRPRSLGGAVDAQLRWYDRLVVPVARWLEPSVGMPFGQSLTAVAVPSGAPRGGRSG